MKDYADNLQNEIQRIEGLDICFEFFYKEIIGLKAEKDGIVLLLSLLLSFVRKEIQRKVTIEIKVSDKPICNSLSGCLSHLKISILSEKKEL